MENKKTKLTISGSSKKNPFKKFDTSKSHGKKTVVISNQNNKNINKGNINKSFEKKSSFFNDKRAGQPKNNFSNKTSIITSDFEKRKLAEQRATKRLKAEVDTKEKKSKLGTKKSDRYQYVLPN